MLMPWDENVTEMTAKKFEIFVKNLLENANDKLEDLKVVHDEKIMNYDGTYQIDVTARFKVFGGDYLLLIECKHHKNPIKREIIQALHDKVRTLGAQKAMVFSTIGFQKGAIKYASQHGIALVRIADGKTTYVTRSLGETHEPSAWAKMPEYVGWFIQEKDNGDIGMSTISNDRLDSLITFLKE